MAKIHIPTFGSQEKDDDDIHLCDKNGSNVCNFLSLHSVIFFYHCWCIFIVSLALDILFSMIDPHWIEFIPAWPIVLFFFFTDPIPMRPPLPSLYFPYTEANI